LKLTVISLYYFMFCNTTSYCRHFYTSFAEGMVAICCDFYVAFLLTVS